MDDKIQIFEDKRIRTAWNEETEEWYFSVVDVVSVLTDSTDGRKYWNKLKQRLKEEGNELVTICHQLKLKSPKDGKRYNTDVADIAGQARENIEKRTGKSVITSKNATELNQVVVDLIEGVVKDEE